jgi:hypothetical protein
VTHTILVRGRNSEFSILNFELLPSRPWGWAEIQNPKFKFQNSTHQQRAIV